MHILFVTPYVPSRIRVRPYHLIKALAKEHTLSLVALLCDEYERGMITEIADYCQSVQLVSLPRRQSYINCLLALPTLTPLRVAYYHSSLFTECIVKVVREQRIDVVHGELIKVVPALRMALLHERVPVVYDAVDCISSYLKQQHSTAGNPLKRAFIFSELKKMQYFEPRALRTFDMVIITAAYDREILIKQGEQPEHIRVVPNGVDTEYFTPLSSPREVDSLVFCAKMDYFPNMQAILIFCREVLPRIWERRPGVRLKIVGNNPPAIVRQLSADKRIMVTGYVPDIRPYLAGASVALAPLLVTAGMQNKVLEALAMGTPLVATPASCRALHVEHGVHLLVAEGAQPFAEAILSLLEQPRLAEQVGRNGRAYVEERHSWSRSAQMLSEIYQQVTRARGEYESCS
jgi:sugar transferase (PEP-CTERM/EpsH1 system associated)